MGTENIRAEPDSLRPWTLIEFKRENLTFIWDNITNIEVGMMNTTLPEFREQQQRTDLVEKLKAGELIVRRGTEPDYQGE